MKLYKSDAFKDKTGKLKSGVVTYIFSDDERDHIKYVAGKIEEVYQLKKRTSLLNSWNDFDREALYEILPWTFHYDDEGKMQDLTASQIDKIERMINKLFDDTNIKFFDLFHLKFAPGYDENTFMSKREMRLEMDRRRALKSKSKPQESTTGSLFDWESIK